MIALIILLVILSGLFLYKALRRKTRTSLSTNKAQHQAIDFKPEIFAKPFPDRIRTIQFHANAIKRGFANGDLSMVNLSYAKFIEAIRQQNVNEHGAYEDYLSAAREEYDRFRQAYQLEYPSQFLPPVDRKLTRRSVASESTRVIVKGDNTKLMALVNDLGGNGHPEYPLLRKEYAIESGIRIADFSGWVVQQLREKDYESLYAFIKEIYLGRDEALENELNEKYVKFLQKDFAGLFDKINSEAILEIQAFFILRHGIDDFNREFWIAEGKNGESLVKILSVYSFSVNRDAFQPSVKRANRFLNEMRKDGDLEYWLEFKDYTLEEIEKEYRLDNATGMAEKLRKLTPGERLHFFDFARHAGNYWNGQSTYSTRSFGINELKSAAHMTELELFHEKKELDAIPEVVSKGELKEAAEKAGFEIKKSWTLQKIYESLVKTESGKKLLSDGLKTQTVLHFNVRYAPDVEMILQNQEKIKRVVDLIAMM
jgi:hypothetical protein